MTEKKRITELNTEKTGQEVDDSQFAVVVNASTMTGKTVTLRFPTEEDYARWQESNQKMRDFINRANNGYFDR